MAISWRMWRRNFSSSCAFSTLLSGLREGFWRTTCQGGSCSVQCVMFSVQCVMCSVQCVMCSVQCVMCSVQCVMCSVQCASNSLTQSFQSSNIIETLPPHSGIHNSCLRGSRNCQGKGISSTGLDPVQFRRISYILMHIFSLFIHILFFLGVLEI